MQQPIFLKRAAVWTVAGLLILSATGCGISERLAKTPWLHPWEGKAAEQPKPAPAEPAAAAPAAPKAEEEPAPPAPAAPEAAPAAVPSATPPAAPAAPQEATPAAPAPPPLPPAATFPATPLPSEGPQITPPPHRGAPETYTVVVPSGDYAFVPRQLTIYEGDTVEWKNESGVVHLFATIPGSDPTGFMEIEPTDLNVGERVSHTFKKAGSYPYFCFIHNRMVGKVEVLPR